MPQTEQGQARPDSANADDKLLAEPTTENRAAFLRWLAQGEGMTEQRLWLMSDVTEQLFGTGQGDDVYALITSAYNTLVRSEFRDAIGNALGIDYDGPDEQAGSLSERRDYYRYKHGMSPRTVIRHEDKGAQLLAKQIEQTPLTTGFKRVVLRKMIEELSNAEIKALITSIPRMNDVVREMCAETDV